MSDLNSINKHKCKSCSKEIDFIWASSIYNNNEFSRLCTNCREDLINNLYKIFMKSHYIQIVIHVNAQEPVTIQKHLKMLVNQIS